MASSKKHRRKLSPTQIWFSVLLAEKNPQHLKMTSTLRHPHFLLNVVFWIEFKSLPLREAFSSDTFWKKTACGLMFNSVTTAFQRLFQPGAKNEPLFLTRRTWLATLSWMVFFFFPRDIPKYAWNTTGQSITTVVTITSHCTAWLLTSCLPTDHSDSDNGGLQRS